MTQETSFYISINKNSGHQPPEKKQKLEGPDSKATEVASKILSSIEGYLVDNPTTKFFPKLLETAIREEDTDTISWLESRGVTLLEKDLKDYVWWALVDEEKEEIADRLYEYGKKKGYQMDLQDYLPQCNERSHANWLLKKGAQINEKAIEDWVANPDTTDDVFYWVFDECAKKKLLCVFLSRLFNLKSERDLEELSKMLLKLIKTSADFEEPDDSIIGYFIEAICSISREDLPQERCQKALERLASATSLPVQTLLQWKLSDGHFPIHWICRTMGGKTGSLDLFASLLKQFPVLLEQKSPQGETLLEYCVHHSTLPLIRYVADCISKELAFTPVSSLLQSSILFHPDEAALIFLVSHFPWLVELEKETLFDFAIKGGTSGQILFLSITPGITKKKTSAYLFTLIDRASSDPSMITVMNALLQNLELDPNEPNAQKQTPLHYLMMQQTVYKISELSNQKNVRNQKTDATIIGSLSRHGAKPWLKDSNHRTVVALAFERNPYLASLFWFKNTIVTTLRNSLTYAAFVDEILKNPQLLVGGNAIPIEFALLFGEPLVAWKSKMTFGKFDEQLEGIKKKYPTANLSEFEECRYSIELLPLSLPKKTVTKEVENYDISSLLLEFDQHAPEKESRPLLETLLNNTKNRLPGPIRKDGPVVTEKEAPVYYPELENNLKFIGFHLKDPKGLRQFFYDLSRELPYCPNAWLSITQIKCAEIADHHNLSTAESTITERFNTALHSFYLIQLQRLASHIDAQQSKHAFNYLLSTLGKSLNLPEAETPFSDKSAEHYSTKLKKQDPKTQLLMQFHPGSLIDLTLETFNRNDPQLISRLGLWMKTNVPSADLDEAFDEETSLLSRKGAVMLLMHWGHLKIQTPITPRPEH